MIDHPNLWVVSRVMAPLIAQVVAQGACPEPTTHLPFHLRRVLIGSNHTPSCSTLPLFPFSTTYAWLFSSNVSQNPPTTHPMLDTVCLRLPHHSGRTAYIIPRSRLKHLPFQASCKSLFPPSVPEGWKQPDCPSLFLSEASVSLSRKPCFKSKGGACNCMSFPTRAPQKPGVSV